MAENRLQTDALELNIAYEGALTAEHITRSVSDPRSIDIALSNLQDVQEIHLADGGTIIYENGQPSPPELKFSALDSAWTFTNNGVDYQPLQGTDNPQPQTTFGDGTQPTSITLNSGANDAALIVDQAGANDPSLRFNNATQKWEYSNDGVTYQAIGSGGGGTPVYAIYKQIANKTLNTGYVSFDTMESESTTGLVTNQTTDWTFTVPIGQAGVYGINVTLAPAVRVTSWSTSKGLYLAINGSYLNGVKLDDWWGDGNAARPLYGSTCVSLAEGDTIQIYCSELSNIDIVSSRISIVKLDGIKGDKGDPGATGAEPVYAVYKCTSANVPYGGAWWMNFNSKIYDTDSAASDPGDEWRYTVPVGKSGLYSVKLDAPIAGSSITGNEIVIDLYKNGDVFNRISRIAPATSTMINASGSVDVYLNDNGGVNPDYIRFRVNSVGVGGGVYPDWTGSVVSVTKLDGIKGDKGDPGSLTLGDPVSAICLQSYIGSPSSGVIGFDTIVEDTDNAVTGTGASWKFTVSDDRSGLYSVKVVLPLSFALNWAGGQLGISLYKNGVVYSNLDSKFFDTNVEGVTNTLTGSTNIRLSDNGLAPNDYITINFAGNGQYVEIRDAILAIAKIDGIKGDKGDPGVGVLPSGAITQYAGTTAPTDFLLCDGTSYPQSSYPALFAVIGTTYGSDSTSDFKVPNLKGVVPAGMDSTQSEFLHLGHTGGSKTAVATLPAHTHTVSAWSGSGNYGYFYPGNYEKYNSTSSTTSEAGSGDGTHTNLQPYIVLNYIIKT